MNEEMRSLDEERKQVNFPTRELTYILDGGKEQTEYYERIMLMIERDPELMVKHFYDMSREEARTKSMQQIRRVVEIRNAHKNDPKFREALNHVINCYDRSLAMRLYVHDFLFWESVWAQGTPEQWNKWKDDIINTRVLGCFSMTEMGHSSYLRGLETTATFDKENDEFIINTPTLTATKWWIGMAGQVATHTVALCKLIIDGVDNGIHWFIIPLRSRLDGRLLPGVTCGDVGSKMGRQGLDNGWLQFTNVRIPREYMLMKWAKVSRDGKFTPPENPTVAYASLIGERLFVPAVVADMVGQAVTIAIRYGAVRRQGPRDEKLLWYQSHQLNLMPILAGIFANRFTFQFIDKYWKDSIILQEKGQDGQKEFLKRTPDIHSITAGIKAWSGWWGSEALEICRRCLGGHGYSSYNAIGGLIGDWGVITTGGGDNVVLAQQFARYLLNSYQKFINGKSISGLSVSFIGRSSEILKYNKLMDGKELDINHLITSLELLSLSLLNNVSSDLSKSISDGVSLEDSWNIHMSQLLDISKVSTFLFIISQFNDKVKSIDNGDIKEILNKLLLLFTLSIIKNLSTLFLEYQYISPNQSRLISKSIINLCKEIRPYSVHLVDSFNYPDWIIKSPLGRKDGNIYENYFNTVLNAPNAIGVPSYWSQFTKPLFDKEPISKL